MTADQLVMPSIVGTGILVTVDAVAHGHAPTARTVVGVGLLAVVLGATSDSVPQVAGPLALLVFLGVLFTLGGRTINTITSGLTKSSPSTARRFY